MSYLPPFDAFAYSKVSLSDSVVVSYEHRVSGQINCWLTRPKSAQDILPPKSPEDERQVQSSNISGSTGWINDSSKER